ncbi:hypothetical protein B7P43_G01597 [Cryptotermes secundus]|uniref:Uncharacterized protein n=1 Tax=Cryptotermes secundus TaxID=105785 RepID=A0A2J7RHS0_9NEOP|nr:hypothetical protein B7P43_G01597 [Cryptotermes secundus]
MMMIGLLTLHILSFWGLIIDNTLSWNGHVDWLMSRLGSACYAIRALKSCMSQGTLRMIYFSYFHSVMTYGLVFWGNSPYSIHIFSLQKRAIRIIMNSGNRDSCRELFTELEILPLQSQYIFSLAMFMVNNKDQFKFNSELYNRNTRYNNKKFHYPTCKLTVFQKGVYYHGITVFNWLPPNIRNLAQDVKHFKIVLRRFLLMNSFYSLEDYFDCKFDPNN